MNPVAFSNVTIDDNIVDTSILRVINWGWEPLWIPVLIWLTIPVVVGFDLAYRHEFVWWKEEWLALIAANIISILFIPIGIVVCQAVGDARRDWEGRVELYKSGCKLLGIDPDAPLNQQIKQAQPVLQDVADSYVIAKSISRVSPETIAREAVLSHSFKLAKHLCGDRQDRGGHAHSEAIQRSERDHALALAADMPLERYRQMLAMAATDDPGDKK